MTTLCYHKITSRLDFGIGTRTPDDFRADVAWATSLPASMKPRFSFDDGYEDTFSTAYPILADAHETASLFVTTDCLGKLNRWDANFFGAFRHITLPQVRALSQAGWTIGSHGKTHRALTLLSARDLQHELEFSKKFLEDACGKAVDRISFPFGAFDGRVLEACRAAGYTGAISIARRSPEGYVQRGKAVYRFDRLRHLHAKLSGSAAETLRLNAINAFSSLTVAMQALTADRALSVER